MTKTKKLLPILLLIIILATVAFIWSNSMPSIPESKAESLEVVEVVKPVLEPIVGPGNVTDHLVRKLAHFVEFGVLGCELMQLVIVRKRRGVQPLINCLFAGLAVAVIDETIQIFSGRGSQVQDVWLDFAGAATGLFFVLLISFIVRAIRKRRQSQTPQEK